MSNEIELAPEELNQREPEVFESSGRPKSTTPHARYQRTHRAQAGLSKRELEDTIAQQIADHRDGKIQLSASEFNRLTSIYASLKGYGLGKNGGRKLKTKEEREHETPTKSFPHLTEEELKQPFITCSTSIRIERAKREHPEVAKRIEKARKEWFNARSSINDIVAERMWHVEEARLMEEWSGNIYFALNE